MINAIGISLRSEMRHLKLHSLSLPYQKINCVRFALEYVATVSTLILCMPSRVVRIVTLQARQAGTQTYKTTCFPFRKAGGFLCLLRLLPQALANNTCSGTRSGGLRLRDQRSLTIERQDRRPSGQRSVIFFKLGKQRSYPILSVEEKNRLWKLVLKKATVYRSPDDEVTIRIWPNLPK